MAKTFSSAEAAGATEEGRELRSEWGAMSMGTDGSQVIEE